MSSIARNPSGFTTPDQIVILDTTNASSTNGSLYVEGGASLHDIFSNGHVMINNVDVTPNLNDIVYERESVLSNNVNVWTSIPDFEFDSSISRSFTSYIYITVSTGTPKYAYREINGLFKSPGGWTMSTYFSGDITGVIFQITTESGIGKIQYKNVNSSGTTTIRYRATTNAPPGSSPLGVASGIIENLTGPFTANKFIYANTNKTLASTDIEYNANQLVVGGTSRLLLENANSFEDFSAGGSLTSMGDASIAQKLIVGQRIGIANTSPDYQLDIIGDINFSGDLYQNGMIYSGGWGGGGLPTQWSSGTGGNLSYTKGNVGIGTTAPTFKLDINGNLRATTGITTASIFSSECNLTNVISTNVTTATLNVTNSTITSLVISNSTITNVVSTTSSSGTVVATTYTGGSMSLSGNLSIAGTLTTVNITTTNLVDTNISTGSVTATNATATNITTATLNASTGITTASAQITNSNVTTQTIATARITTSLLAIGNSNTLGSIVTTGGNVGIGTTSPQYALDINSSDVFTAMRINGSSTLSNTNGVVLSMSPNNGAFGSIEAYTSGNFNSKIPLCLNAWGGNVGIGTTSPSQVLDILTNANDELGMVLTNSNTGGNSRINFNMYVGYSTSGNAGQIYASTSDPTFTIRTYSANTSGISLLTGGAAPIKFFTQNTERMRINTSGNIGIGTTSPQYKLDINGNINVTGNFSNISNSTTGYLQLVTGWQSNSGYVAFLQADGTRKGYIGYGGDTVAFQLIGEGSRNIELATNSTIQMTITSSGNVGIGATAPSVRLQVMNGGQSTARIYGSGNAIYTDWPTGWGGGLNTYDISCAGIYYSTLSQRSDVRKKQNINTYTRGLQEVLQLRPVSFNWKEYNQTETQYGFIAQEVEAIIPEIVDEDSEGYKNIKHAYIPMLVNAIKGLQNQIDQIKQNLGLN